MWLTLSELLAQVLAAVAVAAAVRFLDDAVDGHRDSPLKGFSSSLLGEGGRVAYALFFFALAVVFDRGWAVTLFLAAYAVGMASEPGRALPSGLPSWVESAVAAIVSLGGFGLPATISSLAAVASVQAVDDLVDRKKDRLEGRRGNWALALGVPTVSCLLVGLLLLGAAVHPWKTVVVAGVGGIFTALRRRGFRGLA